MRRNLRVFNAKLRLAVVLLSGCLTCLCDGQVYTYPSGYVYDAGAASGLTERQQRRIRNSRPSSRNGSSVSNRRSSRYQSSQEQTGYQNSQIQYTSNPYSETQNSQSQISSRDYTSQYSSNRISHSTSSSSQYYTVAGQYSTVNNQRTSASNTRTPSRSQYESYSSRNGPRPLSQQTQPTVVTSTQTTTSLRSQQQPSHQVPSSSSASSSSSRYPTSPQAAQSQNATPTTYASNVRVEQTPGSVDNNNTESTDQQVRDPYVPYKPRNSILNRTSPSDQSQEVSIGVIEIEQKGNNCNVGIIGSAATCED